MKETSSIPPKMLSTLRDIFGNLMSIDGEVLDIHSHDCTEDLKYKPACVVYPENSEQVSKLLALCNRHEIPVTPQGGQTGLSGGALAVNGGIALSFKRMNRILEIDEKNFMACVEPGVITGDLQRAVWEKGLFYPPDPASKDSCFIGGNVAENSGGPRAVKYGVTSGYVLNLEAVLPSGEIITTGANTLKNATGYNLTQLLTGSEGTLAVVTRIYLRLISRPEHNLLLWVPFAGGEVACSLVAEIFRKGFDPSALEFMERSAIEWSLEYSNVSMDIPSDAGAFLLIELDGNNSEQLTEAAEGIFNLLEPHACGEILLAQEPGEKEKLWKIRRNCAEGVHARSVYKEEDTVVPRYELPRLLNEVKATGDKYGFRSVCYGHAGDGNLHVNILKDDLSEDVWNNELPLAIREIFSICVGLGGTISGEHGIGLVQRQFMDIPFSKAELNIMRGIKKVFDPNNILNPGKIF